MIGPRGHPLHPVLAIAPLALLGAALASDVALTVTGDPHWVDAARFSLGASLIAAVVVAIPGIVDGLAYPVGARAVPVRHGVLNGVAFALVAASWALRPDQAPLLARMLAIAGAGIAIVAWRVGRRLTR